MIEIINRYTERSFKFNLFVFLFTTKTYESICWHRETRIKFFGIKIYSSEKVVADISEL